MVDVKSGVQKIFPVVPFILVNTIPFVPYLVFLHLHTGKDLESVLPFVLFYTVRMTGVFLLKSFRSGLTLFHVVLLAMISGGVGSVFGILGTWWYPCYFISAVLLGLSAAWLPPANTTFKYQKKELKVRQRPTSFFDLLLLCLMLGAFLFFLAVDFPIRISLIFLVYTCLYLLALFQVGNYRIQSGQLNKIDQQLFFMKEFLLFLAYFVLLIVIRLARALFDSQLLTAAVLGFSVLLVVSAWYINEVHKKWKLPVWVNLLTFINGMCTNFILLFGTFYASFYFGSANIVLYLYVPYIVGILSAKLLMNHIYKLFSKLDQEVFYIFGLILSLLLLLLPKLFPIGVFLFSTFITGTSSYLNQLYVQNNELPRGRQIIIKYSTQAKGSIIHQLLMMSALWVTAQEFDVSISSALQLISRLQRTTGELRVVNIIHYFSIGLILYLLLFILYERLFKNKKLTLDE